MATCNIEHTHYCDTVEAGWRPCPAAFCELGENPGLSEFLSREAAHTANKPCGDPYCPVRSCATGTSTQYVPDSNGFYRF